MGLWLGISAFRSLFLKAGSIFVVELDKREAMVGVEFLSWLEWES